MNRHATTSDVERILRTLHALGTGGALGAAAALTAYALVPAVVSAGLSLHVVVAGGAAAGTALHRTIAPVLACLSHYRQLLEIQLEWRLGLMSDGLADHLRTELQLRYFLRDGPISQRTEALILITSARIREQRCACHPDDALRQTGRERRSRRSSGCKS